MNFPDFRQFYGQNATGLKSSSKDSSFYAAPFALYLHRWLTWANMVLHKKLFKNEILRGLKLRRLSQNQINLR